MADQAQSTSTPTTATTSPAGPPQEVIREASAQKLVIGGGILIVLLVAFVFVKNGYSNMLVGWKVAPRSANTAGWFMWVLLSSVAALILCGIISQGEWLNLFVVIPLGLVALLALVFMVASSRR